MHFHEHEKEIARFLVRDGLAPELVEKVLGFPATLEQSPAGYFLRVAHEELPEKRAMYHKPLLTTDRNGVEAGYLVYVENKALVFECHSFGQDELGPSYREARTSAFSKVLVSSKSANIALATKALEFVVGRFPKLIAFAGPQCDQLEDICDEFCEQSENGLDVSTTSHSGETLAEVREFVEMFDRDTLGPDYLTIQMD